VSPVHPRPLRKASADPLGLVSLIHHSGPTARTVDAGTGGLGLVLAPLRGRSPRSRCAEFFAPPDTARLWGTACPPPAFPEETVGRVRARFDALGPRRLLTAGAVRAVTRCAVARRSVPGDTTARRGWGASPCAAPQALPCQGTSGERQAKRPDLKPGVLSPCGGERAGPCLGEAPQDAAVVGEPATLSV
jgi:hypothetical protein